MDKHSVENNIYDLEEIIKIAIEDLEKDDKNTELNTPILKNIDETLHSLYRTIDDLNIYNQHLLTYVYGITLSEQYFKDYKNTYGDRKSSYVRSSVKRLKENLDRIQYLKLLNEDINVLVGANGSGKSSFASYFATNVKENVVVISAQKSLFLDQRIENYAIADDSRLEELNSSNFIEDTRNLSDVSLSYEVQNLSNNVSKQFSYYMAIFMNKYVEQLQENKNRSEFPNLLDDFTNIWNQILPDIKFIPKTTLRILMPYKENNITNTLDVFSINSLSDGEKVIMYYIFRILLAPPNSFIIIDEPDSNVNLSILNLLWDILEQKRQDCNFTYITHNVEFVTHRKSNNILWIKEYIYPNEWRIQSISSDSELPTELIVEIAGSKRKILLCEGTRSSLDYQIYSILFRDKFNVYPANSCKDVIERTRSANKQGIFPYEINGIIDNDALPVEMINGYTRSHIHVTPFFEIESLLIVEDILIEILKINGYINYEDKLEEIKASFINYCNSSKSKIYGEVNKRKLDFRLSNTQSSSKDPDVDKHVEDYVKKLNGDIKQDMLKTIEDVNEKINTRDYYSYLQIFPLKKDAVNHIATLLNSDYKKYKNVVINLLKSNDELRINITNKYFPDLA